MVLWKNQKKSVSQCPLQWQSQDAFVFFRSYWQEEGVTVHVYMQDEKSRQAQSVNLSGLVISRPCEK